jgi:hypothetical protein
MDASLNSKRGRKMTYRSLESIIRTGAQAGSYKSFRSALASIYEQKIKKLETHYKDQIVVGQYRTFNFEMEPKAQLLFVNLPDDVNVDKAEKCAQFLDQLFAMEKSVVASKKATGEDIAQAEKHAEKAIKMGKEAGIGDKLDFVQKHIADIKAYHKVEDLNPNTDVSPEDIKTKFTRPSLAQTPEPKDMDIDNQKFRISRNLKMQRKLKIIDND